ncbi:MAG: AraC family transcriptional regulator [Chitinophagaceae bacterium]|nr:AraC family transcriptional regulator [Chitinophagaceae bacterium]
MKAVLRQITSTPDHSFLIRKDARENMVNNWHYHPEIELLFIKKSSGTWLIGDHIGHFQSGDVVLIGPDLPHCFRHEKKYTAKKSKIAGETICIKFLPEIFGSPFLNMPEAKGIKELLSKSSCGLRLTGKTKMLISKTIDKIADASPGRKLVDLLSILEEMAENKEYTVLSSKGFMQSPGDMDKERIKTIFEYTFNHYHSKITIDHLASRLNMTRESFCRYFKSKTRKTYIQFLMEVRIGYACRLLVEDEKNVAGISYECGYNNISHFNHQFKFITGKKPLEYKKDYLKQDT